MTRTRRADLALLAVAFVWGSTFVLVRNAVQHVGPLTFLAVRFALASLVLVALWGRHLRHAGRPALAAGCVAGVLLFAGYALQTAGLRETSATRAGFITGLTVAIVPFAAWPVLRRRPTAAALAGAAIATAGLALLSLQPDDRLVLGSGDRLVLGCAVAFALHLTVLGAAAPSLDVRALATTQILTAAVLAGVGARLVEPWPWVLTPSVLAAAAFTGLFATAAAFAIQTAAQAFTTPAHTALLFATEPVFAALTGVALAGERLPARGWLGCALILAGVVLAELRAERAHD